MPESGPRAANLELIAHMAETWNGGDLEEALGFVDPEIEVLTPFSSVTGEPYRGLEGYRRWRSDIDEQFDAWEMHYGEVRELDRDLLLVSGFARVRGRGSGIEFDQPATSVVELRDGRLLRLSVHLSEAEALEAAARRR
jgi:ketosteroid isomerase-like protein